MGKKERQARREARQLKKALKNVVETQADIPADTRSVWVKDYEGGGSEVTKTETSGTTGTTTTTRTRTRSAATGEIITPTTETIVRDSQGRTTLQKTEVAQPSYSDLKTQEELRKESQRLVNYYQDLYNKGQIGEQEANAQINKNYQDYQRRYYEQLGYTVDVNKETGEFNLQRDYKEPTVLELKEVTTTPYQIQKQESIIGKMSNIFFPYIEKKTTYPSGEVTIQEAQLGFFGGLGKRLEESEAGKKIIAKYPFLSAKEIKVGNMTIQASSVNQFVSEMGKSIFFAPAISTFAYSKGQKQIVKALSSNRFAGLSDAEKAQVVENVKGKITKDLLNKKTFNQQAKYLNDIYKTLKTQEAKDGFKLFVQNLMNEGFLKTPSTIISTNQFAVPPTQIPTLTVELNRLPTNLEYSSILTGLGAAVGIGNKPPQEQQPTKQKKETGTAQTTILGITPIVIPKPIPPTPKPHTTTIQATQQVFAQPSIQIQPQVPIQIQRISQVPRLKTPQLTSQIYKFKQPQPPIFLKKQLALKSQNVFKLSPAKKGLFEAFLKRKGKDISLGKFGELGAAKTKFLKEVKGTLGASGFITKEGKPVAFKELKLGFEFKPSKKQSFRIVQKRGFRLGTRAEVQEIQKSRRKNVKWL